MKRAFGERDGVDNAALFALPSLQVAAHELKAPLALIRQLTQSLAHDDLTKAEITELGLKIGLTTERALRLTNDLTKSTRLEGRLFELEPIDPVPLCRDVIAEISPLYGAKGREVRLAPRQRSVPLVVGHRDLLRRIILNFADNALHYAEVDRPVELSLLYKRHDDMIRLGVRDYGPGLAAGVRSRLDSRLSNPDTISYRPASSGLGLYIAQQFASAMQAKVGAVAHRDGASFYVDVPRSAQMGFWA